MTLTATDRATLEGLLSREWDRAYARRTRLLIEGLDPVDGERILDCGCGMGFHLMTLARLRALRLVGTDRNAFRLRMALRAGAPRCFAGSSLVRLPFPDASFDKVLASEVIEHVPDDSAVLAEIFRVLRPGGLLALSVPHVNFPFAWDPISRIWGALGGRPIRRGPLVGIWTGHERLYGPRDLAACVAGAGFEPTDCLEASHYALPFGHFLLYGIGKPLLEHGLLPRGFRAAVDRLGAGDPPRRGPLAWALSVLTRIDALNDEAGRHHAPTYINVVLFARKPARGRAAPANRE